MSKSSYRSGIKTVVMGILFSLVSFVLLSQAIEHNITHKGLMEAAGHYFGVGSVEISPPNTPMNANPGFPYHLTLDGSASEQYALLSHEHRICSQKLCEHRRHDYNELGRYII